MSIVLSKVAEPYAEALLDLAKSNDSLKETAQDINLISTFLSNSSDLKDFLKNPFFTRNAKKNVIANIFSEEIGINTLKFLFLLVDRNRIQVFESISQKYIELSYKQESIEIAKLTSCISLSDNQQKEIAEHLKFITGAKQIKFALKNDPRLLGGFTIEIGSIMIEMSIRGQLKELSAHLGVPEAFVQMESGTDIRELTAMAREKYFKPI